jgi:hypothetical protein
MLLASLFLSSLFMMDTQPQRRDVHSEQTLWNEFSTPSNARAGSLMAERLHHLPPHAPNRLVRISAPNSEAPRFDATRCRGIADLSNTSRPVFIEKSDGQWECSYLLEYHETTHNPSVFIQIRGIQAGIWSSFRVKLNFGSLLSRQVLGARAAALIYALIGDKTPARDLATSLAAGRDFEISFDSIVLKYKRERFDDARYNFTGTNLSNERQAQ